MEPVKPGLLRVVDPVAQRERCLKGAALAFAVGLTIGAGLMQATADDPHNGKITAVLVQIGAHLCKDFEGLKDVASVRQNRYTFRCNDLAVFPNVEVRIQ